MIKSIQRDAIVEMLLNTLEAERYVRGPLLLNVVDELASEVRLAPAADVARELLSKVDRGMPDADFALGIRRIRTLVRDARSPGLVEPRYAARPVAAA